VCHNRARADNRPFSDGHAGHDNAIRADERVLFDGDFSALDMPVFVGEVCRHARAVEERVRGGEDARASRDHRVVGYGELTAADYARVTRDVHISAETRPGSGVQEHEVVDRGMISDPEPFRMDDLRKRVDDRADTEMRDGRPRLVSAIGIDRHKLYGPSAVSSEQSHPVRV
jgi:hypothetical protein